MTWLPTATGLQVAVIDSGIDAAHPFLRGSTVIAGPSFSATGVDDPVGGRRDHLGHGTAVAAIIARLAPSATLLSLRVFDREATCEFTAVLHAMRHALQCGASVINLSLGTTSLRHRKALLELVADALSAHVRIVAPAGYGGLPCDPGSLPGVEAVVGDPNVLPAAPELRPQGGRLVWFASPLPPPDADGVRRLVARGDSLAVGAVSGLLARGPRS